MEDRFKVISIEQPESVIAEEYRTLRTNISMREFDKPMKLINVVSANAQEGKTTTALNLAAVYGQLNKKVLLIDLDLRLPTIHKKLGLKNNVGIADILINKNKLEDSIVNYKECFDVLLSGTKTPFTSELVQSESLRSFLDDVKNRYDIVIVDCPPVNLVSDGIIVSKYCDGTIFCVATNHDERKELEHAKELIDNVGINVIGVVMTYAEPKKHYYDNYYHRKG